MTNRAKFLVGFALFLLLAASLPAQSIYGTLTGVVSDASGAVVPNASVKLRNQASGSLRDSVTNAEGFYTFVSVPVGDFTYELTVETKGFIT